MTTIVSLLKDKAGLSSTKMALMIGLSANKAKLPRPGGPSGKDVSWGNDPCRVPTLPTPVHRGVLPPSTVWPTGPRWRH
jgi:hypothetical protein